MDLIAVVIWQKQIETPCLSANHFLFTVKMRMTDFFLNFNSQGNFNCSINCHTTNLFESLTPWITKLNKYIDI